MKTLEIISPDDWHVHFRDGKILETVVPETSKHFARAIVMPNLTPPVLNGNDAIKYKNRISNAIPEIHNFTPLMTIYLTENTQKKQITEAYEKKQIFAAKLYPAGATTNSKSGVKNLNAIMPLIETMSKIGMPLLIHGEETGSEVDVFDRENEFIDKNLSIICQEFPDLKVTLEHITTKEATMFVKEANNNLSASITPHHLVLNRNALFDDGIRPHHFCFPILKREEHRQALINAATSGHHNFFLGTDTAPHLVTDKESSCGCAGIFNSTYCMSIITQIFDNENSLSTLEKFVSLNGSKHYDLEQNKTTIKLIKKDQPLKLRKNLIKENVDLRIFTPEFPLYWEVL